MNHVHLAIFAVQFGGVQEYVNFYSVSENLSTIRMLLSCHQTQMNSHMTSFIITFCFCTVIIICQKLANLSNRAKQPRAVTRTLMQATLLSAPGTTFLTPLHAIFLQVLFHSCSFEISYVPSEILYIFVRLFYERFILIGHVYLNMMRPPYLDTLPFSFGSSSPM